MKIILLHLGLFIILVPDIMSQSVDDLVTRYEAIGKTEGKQTYWPQYDEVRMKSEVEALEEIIIDLNRIDKEKLSVSDKINADLLEIVVGDDLFSIQSKSYQMPLNAEGGFIAGIVYNVGRHRLDDKASADKYIEKLKALPAYINLRIRHMQEGQERGVSSPKLIAKLCHDMVLGVVNGEMEESFFLAPAKGTTYFDEVFTVFREDILPSYISLSQYLTEEYIPNAPEAIGVSNIADGKAYYEQRVKYFTTDNITPKEVFDIGMAEVKRIREEMQVIIDDLAYEGTFDDFIDFLRTDPQFYAKTPEELLQRAAWITKEMEGILPQYFGLLPRMPLTVKPVPSAIAENYTGGRYSPGSYENNKAGEYWVNTTKLESRPLYVLPSLSLHEGVPGHHTQIMLAAEMELSDFRKNTYLSAFGEGWGLYAEYLGKEAGMYHTPYEDFGRLVYEMWRACRLVVDPGMHYFGWTRDQAVDFMKSNTALSIHEVNTEINRYIGWPGQAVSYKIGELKIRSLRKLAEDRLGAKFDIRAFHDVILQNGSIPLKSLEMVVDLHVDHVMKG